MKKRVYFVQIMMFLVFLLLSACGKSSPTWQEQYDLGVRYLSEGNYEEAIIAFTAAIEIDPKQALAYVGRGDAYVGSGETEENLAAALADYEAAIELDETLETAYLGLADVYIRQGEHEKALEILQQGFELTGSQALEDKLKGLELDEASAEDDDQPLGTISIGGSGRNMSLSLTWPDLPNEVWCNGEDDSHHSAAFTVSISDGIQTLRVWTQVFSKNNIAEMTTIPLSSNCRQVLTVADLHEDSEGMSWSHLESPVSVTRNSDTITWSFNVPEKGFSVSDIRYAGYFLYYIPEADATQVRSHATFSYSQGVTRYLNGGELEDLGFIISSN